MNTPTTFSVKPLSQFAAIVRYELLLLWRARAWLIGAVLIVVLMSLLSLSMSETQIWKDAKAALANATPEDRAVLTLQAERVSLISFTALGTTLHVFGLLLFPILYADVIAKDRQYGVRDLWGSLPLGEGNYLGAKTVAAMLIVLFATVLYSAAVWIIWALLVYPMSLYDYIVSIGLLVVPVALPNTAIIVLLTSSQPTRRRAILVAIGLAVSTLVLLLLGMIGDVSFLTYLNIGHPISVRYYISNFVQMLGTANNTSVIAREIISNAQVALAAVIAFAEVALLWLLVRFFTKRQHA
jgi:hypothetical protein